ncbi:MAG TPA: BTAD domain-containing putative transcriptional regulator [Micromonosporaceae bacterium]|nr:BTAD domain-containing putative transcriptional regulator [Micromonosporaceae bacterium]
MDFRILGPLEVRLDGALALPAPRMRWLLALLLLHNGERITGDRIHRQLWDGGAPTQGAYLTAVSRLRTWLASIGTPLERVSDGYRLVVDPLWSDAGRFTALAQRAAGADDDERRLDLLAEALDEWRGGVLADAPDWLCDDPIALDLTRVRTECAARLGELALALDRPAAALSRIGRQLVHDEYNETLHAVYLRLLVAAGRTAEAVRHYDGLRRRLRDELGVMPSAEVRHVHLEALADEDRPQNVPAPRATAAAQPSASAPAASADATPFRPFQLPPDAPDFTGRREHVEQIVAALSGPSGGAYPNVAMITGMPGTGKSTLAVHIAHALAAMYPDGQLYLDLSSGTGGTLDPREALGRVLVALGYAHAALPATADERMSLLRSASAQRRLLMVLDNAVRAEQVRALLPAGQQCGVLVTGRGPLAGLTAWPRFELLPMERADALEFLRRIVGDARVTTESVAASKIVDLCGGLPLAIRIAGTRMAARSHQRLTWLATRLEDDATRLEQLADGTGGIRGSFDVSYQALEPDVRRAFRLFGLLDVPDFGAWLAAATLGCPLREAENHIDQLVEARLLEPAPAGAVDVPRYRFHQLVRLYARTTADSAAAAEENREALARAYGACLALAEHADQALHRHVKLVASDWPRPPVAEFVGADSFDAAAWFATEYATLGAVVRAGAARGWHDLAWDLSLSLQRFLESHHLLDEWHAVSTAGLDAARARGDLRAEAALLCSVGELQMVQDNVDAAKATFTEALEAARKVDDSRSQGHAHRGLGAVLTVERRLDQSIEENEKALTLLDHHADIGTTADVWMGLGQARHRQRKHLDAMACFERAHEGFVAANDQMNLAILLVNVGTTSRDLGRFHEAQSAFEQAAALAKQIGFRNGEGFAYTALGGMFRIRGETARAETALLSALTIVREYADLSTECLIHIQLGELYRRDNPAASVTHLTDAVELAADLGLDGWLADALIGLGDTERRRGDTDAATAAWRRAYRLLAADDPERAEGVRTRLDALVAL